MCPGHVLYPDNSVLTMSWTCAGRLVHFSPLVKATSQNNEAIAKLVAHYEKIFAESQAAVQVVLSSDSEEGEENEASEDEISIKDILDFFIVSWKKILFAAFLGLLGALAYILLMPNSYEGVMQVQMSQLAAGANKNNLNPLGINIEDPTVLIARLKMPSTFNHENIAACSLSGKKNAAPQKSSLTPGAGQGSIRNRVAPTRAAVSVRRAFSSCGAPSCSRRQSDRPRRG